MFSELIKFIYVVFRNYLCLLKISMLVVGITYEFSVESILQVIMLEVAAWIFPLS